MTTTIISINSIAQIVFTDILTSSIITLSANKIAHTPKEYKTMIIPASPCPPLLSTNRRYKPDPTKNRINSGRRINNGVIFLWAILSQGSDFLLF
jgi:hypothetical protein